MSQQLSLAGRPKSLDALVGQSKLVELIRGQMATGRDIKSWLLTGPTGTGKTTLGRILAYSFQCDHQTVFGKPCKACYTNSGWDFYEINGAKVTTKDDVAAELDGAEYAPRFGNKRVYLLDECHKMSDGAQNLILKMLEAEEPTTTVFILSSTEPHHLLDTIQSRCFVCQLRELDVETVSVLVARLLKRAKSDKPVDRLSDELIEAGVFYPRSIAQAVEKYVAGAAPADAVAVWGSGSVDTSALLRSVVKGDWPGVCDWMKKMQAGDVRSVRLSILAYLRAALLGQAEISDRTEAIARNIEQLCDVQNAADLVISAHLSAVLYRVTALFNEYKL